MKLTWIAYCPECGKELDETANGTWVEAEALLHAKITGHEPIVGFKVKAEKEVRASNEAIS